MPSRASCEDRSQVMASLARHGMPYMVDELPGLLLEMCIRLEKNTPSGEPYTEATDVRHLAASFQRRCEEKGVPLVPRTGRVRLPPVARSTDVTE